MSGKGSPEGTEGLSSRRQFTVEMAMALLGGASITIACGGGGGGSPSGPTAVPTPAPTPSDEKAGVIAQNHGHEAILTGAQLQAGNALLLDIMGVAAHGHTVELSGEEVGRIRGGNRVEKTSTEQVGLFGPHTHVVRFN